MNKYRTNKVIYIIGIAFQVAALVLEILPTGAVLRFADGPTRTIIRTYSYFDMMLWGYANITPMLTGIMTIAVIIFGILALCRHEKADKIRKAAFICSIVAIILSIVPFVLFGSSYMTMISYIISSVMAVSICLQAVANRKSQRNTIEQKLPE